MCGIAGIFDLQGKAPIDSALLQTMNQTLFMLAHGRKITQDDALSRSSDIDELKQMFANPASILRRQQAKGATGSNS
jgi:Tfp pilus assembly ATPase PilU